MRMPLYRGYPDPPLLLAGLYCVHVLPPLLVQVTCLEITTVADIDCSVDDVWMDSSSYSMNSAEYSQRPQQWQPHLLPPEHYPFYHQDRTATPHDHARAAALSLNISSLTVTSPTNLSPINPSPSSALSPSSTPISPSSNPFPHPHHHFQFEPPSQQQNHYDEHASLMTSTASSPYDTRRTPAPSRSSSSSSTSHLPRKRSFTSNPSTTSLSSTLVEENIYDETPDASMDLGGYDEIDIRGYTNTDGSPVEGSGSGGEDSINATNPAQIGLSITMPAGGGASNMNMVGKSTSTNNFVSKLYQ